MKIDTGALVAAEAVGLALAAPVVVVALGDLTGHTETGAIHLDQAYMINQDDEHFID